MRISDWSSDVCSSDLHRGREVPRRDGGAHADRLLGDDDALAAHGRRNGVAIDALAFLGEPLDERGGVGDLASRFGQGLALLGGHDARQVRSEEHTSELQSLMRISYAAFCLTKKKKQHAT